MANEPRFDEGSDKLVLVFTKLRSEAITDENISSYVGPLSCRIALCLVGLARIVAMNTMTLNPIAALMNTLKTVYGPYLLQYVALCNSCPSAT